MIAIRPFFNFVFFAISSGVLFLGSCKKEEKKKELQIPADYSSVDYENNTLSESGIRRQFSLLTAYMKRAESVSYKLDNDSLLYFYSQSGSPTLSAITASYYDNLIRNSWFPVLVSSSGNNYDPAWGDTATRGGVYGNRLLDKRAKETLQEIDKGLYAAALYNYILKIAEQPLTVASVDRMIAICGAHKSFPNTNTISKTSNPDEFIALYAARRDKNDGTGIYTQIKRAFIKLKAAVEAGSDYNAERDAALADLKSGIEKAIMATVANYCYSATTKLSSTNPPATTISGGLHDLGECVGFIHGFKAIPAVHRRISDTQIDEMLALLNSPAGADSEMYKFVTDGANQLGKISQLLNKIKSVYGFSTAEMEDFKQNWISIQGR